MNLLQAFKEYISSEELFHPNEGLLLAVSGGIDSVVLCELCHQAGFHFVIAHCNFQLRAEESTRDEQFVRALAEKYQVQILVKHFDTAAIASSQKISIQVAARELRYAWFHEMIDQFAGAGQTDDKPLKLSCILTAHHADDNTETMLMNFFRGTGIRGLRGILPRHGELRRPLLSFQKEELQNFAGLNSLTWVEDSSNEQDKYSRNYFRHQVIPLVKNIFPETEKNLLDNAKRFREIGSLYEQAIASHKKKLLEKNGNEIRVPVLKLLKTEPLETVLYEILRDFNFSSRQVPEVISLLQSETGKYASSTTHRILKNRNWLLITPLTEIDNSVTVIDDGDEKINYPGGELAIKKISSYKFSADTSIAFFDASAIRFPLIVRKWKKGDYFYPLGMKKKKKLARFLIDQKLSMADKEKVWVLEMNKKILWIIGMRIDERFKITDNTKQILSIKVN